MVIIKEDFCICCSVCLFENAFCNTIRHRGFPFGIQNSLYNGNFFSKISAKQLISPFVIVGKHIIKNGGEEYTFLVLPVSSDEGHVGHAFLDGSSPKFVGATNLLFSSLIKVHKPKCNT